MTGAGYMEYRNVIPPSRPGWDQGVFARGA